jgi:hypothetical protein
MHDGFRLRSAFNSYGRRGIPRSPSMSFEAMPCMIRNNPCDLAIHPHLVGFGGRASHSIAMSLTGYSLETPKDAITESIGLTPHHYVRSSDEEKRL